MKIKAMTYGDYRRKFGGLRRLRCDWTYKQVTYGHGLFPIKFQLDCGYSKKKDVTYVMIGTLGFIDLFGLDDDREVYVARIDGKVEFEDPNEDLKVIEPLLEELEMKYNEEKKES